MVISSIATFEASFTWKDVNVIIKQLCSFVHDDSFIVVNYFVILCKEYLDNLGGSVLILVIKKIVLILDPSSVILLT